MSKKKIAYMFNEKYISFVADGVPYTIKNTDENWSKAVELVKKNNIKEIIPLIDKPKMISNFSKGKLKIVNGEIVNNGVAIKGKVVEKIKEFYQNGFPHEPLLKFFEKLSKNPSKRAVDELYKFLEDKNIVITEEGNCIGYKSVQPNWTDWHTGKISNKIGDAPTMERNEVDDNFYKNCSSGLHIGNLEYATNFNNSPGRHLIMVEFDPKDVVSFHDAENGKIRVCKYKVISEYFPHGEKIYSNKLNKNQKAGPKRDANGRFVKA